MLKGCAILTLVIEIIFFLLVPIIVSLKNEIIDEKLNCLNQTNRELIEGNQLHRDLPLHCRAYPTLPFWTFFVRTYLPTPTLPFRISKGYLFPLHHEYFAVL